MIDSFAILAISKILKSPVFKNTLKDAVLYFIFCKLLKNFDKNIVEMFAEFF
jgi:hypothetical protein